MITIGVRCGSCVLWLSLLLQLLQINEKTAAYRCFCCIFSTKTIYVKAISRSSLTHGGTQQRLRHKKERRLSTMARSVILARLLSQKIVSRRTRSLPPYTNLALQLISTTIDEKKVGTNVMVTRKEGVGAASSTSSSRFARPNKTDGKLFGVRTSLLANFPSIRRQAIRMLTFLSFPPLIIC